MKKFKKFWNDQSGQVGGIFTFVLALGIFSLIYIIFSVLMDHIIIVNNEFMGTFHYTQEYVDALSICFLWWRALPIIILLSLIVFLIKNAVKARTETIE